MTAEVREVIRKRNALRKKLGSHGEKWMKTCKEAQEAIRKTQEENWWDLIPSATNDQKGRYWNVIKTLKGTRR